MTTRVPRAGGMSLVELMVALTIGLIILAAVSTVFVNSKVSYTTHESLARLQENGRFALHFLARDLRMAGYYGCSGDVETINSTLNPNGVDASAFDFTNPIEAVVGNELYPSQTDINFPTGGGAVESKDADCPGTIGGRCAGTGGFAVRMADPSTSVALQKTMPNTSAVAFVNPSHGLEEGEIVMLSDCASADIFQITGIGNQNASGKIPVGHNAGAADPGNSTQKLSRVYEEGKAEIMKFVHRVYYIGTGRSGYPSLFRMGADGSSPEELVEGIESLDVVFGVDTAGDRTPRAYLPATSAKLGTTPANWANAVSARVTVSARPTIQGVSSSAPYPIEVEPKQFVATVLMRNLQ